jgi:hypothetical protein
VLNILKCYQKKMIRWEIKLRINGIYKGVSYLGRAFKKADRGMR